VHLINADPRQERWHAEEESWRGRQGRPARREMLLTTGEFVVFGEDGQPRPAESKEAARTAWLTAWAEELNQRIAAIPIVRPAPRPLSTASRLAIAGCLALAIGGLCAAHYTYVRKFQLDPARAEVQRLRGPVQQMALVDQQAGKLEKDLAEMHKQCDGLREANETLHAQRHRVARLLAALGEHRPEDLLIQKIEGNIGEPVIHGVCLTENMANQLASRLGRSLAPDWQIRATKVEAQQRRADGGPFVFHLSLQLAGPPTPPPAVPGRPGTPAGGKR
jgi:hypothetical protein